MKKIYPLLLTTLVAGSAMAVNPNVEALRAAAKTKSFTTSSSAKTNREVSRKLNVTKSAERGDFKTPVKAPRKAEGDASKYEGIYTLTMCDDVFQNSTGAITPYEVNVTVSDNQITFSCSDFDPITADFDASTGVVTFVNTYLGAGTSQAWSYMPVDFKTSSMFSSFTATFSEDGSTLNFPSDCGMMEGVWGWSRTTQKNAAIADAQSFNTNSNYFLGWAFGQTFVSMTKGGFTYSPAGTVTYYDGLMTVNDAVNEIYSWDVAVEECDQVENFYRMQPYAVANPVGDALGLGVDADTYVYVNISDPTKVFTKGQFSPYGVETFSGVNAENNFNGDYYGTYEDGVISFPDPSFAYYDGGWYLVDTDGQPNLRIVFEGSVIKDYTIEAFTPSVVSDNNQWTISVTKGADVASVKYMVAPFETTFDELASYGFDFADFGNDVDGESFTIDPAVDNMSFGPMTESDYVTVIVASFDAEGNQKEVTELYLTVLFDDDNEGWATVGTTTFVDPFLAPMFEISYSAEVEVQAKSDNTPVYRLVLPYASFPAFYDMAGKTTSMVIDATDPTWVAIPQYFSGIDAGYGMAAVGSVAALGYTKDNTPSGVGTVTLDGNTITFAAKSAFMHMPLFNGVNRWSQLNAGGAFDLPAIVLNVTVKNADGTPAVGATVSLQAPVAAQGIAAMSDDEVVTDAEGKATLDIPFSTGYFGSLPVYINGTDNMVTLEGATTDTEITLIHSGIEEISSADNAAVVYDLLGRRVNNPTKGIYIVNGKKTVIK